MGIEIERKYLVTGEGWRTAAHAVIPMAQGYLNDTASLDSGAQKASVRVRIQGEQAFLNMKSREIGHTRQEFDYPIPVEDARALLALCVGGLIDKRRHLVEHDGLLWEVDEFLGENWWWPKWSLSTPTRRSRCPTGRVRKSPTRCATTTWPWPRTRFHAGPALNAADLPPL